MTTSPASLRRDASARRNAFAAALCATTFFFIGFSLPENAFLRAQTSPVETITVEGIYTGAYRDITALPTTFWLVNGSLVLYDVRKPAAERLYEILDPKSGKRSPMFDMAKARASMKTLRGTENFPPLNFSADGAFAYLELGEELALFDVKKVEFRSIAKEVKEGTVRFSPDGKKIAYVKKNDMYVFDFASAQETRLTNDGTETTLNGTHSWVYWEEVFDRDDRGFTWSPDSRAIAYYQSDESMVSQVVFPDVQPAVPENIYQRYPKAGGANPKVKLGVVEIDKPQQTVWLEIIAGDKPEVEYLARAQWLPDGKRLAVQTMPRHQREVTLYLAERSTGKLTPILTETDPGWINLNDDLHFFKDGKRFLIASERTGFNHLYLYSTDGKLLNAVTKGSWAVGEARGTAIQAVDESKGLIYFKANEKSSVERHLYVVKLDGTGMKRLTEENGSHAVRFNSAATHYTDIYSTISTPPALRLHSAEGKRTQEIAPANAQAAAARGLLYPSLFTIPVDAEFQMPAQMLKPRNFDPAKRYPVIIYVYGGPSAPNVVNAWQSDNYFYQILADAGYIVVKMDNRSAAGISKKFENACLRELAGDSELNDLLAGVRWLKEQSFVDSARIGVWGWSFGGAFTLLGMTRSTAFKAGIAVAAPTDWRFYDTKYTEAFMKTPADNPEGYEKTNLNRYAKDLHGRLLLVHGTYDDNVHPQNAWNFINALIRANKRFDTLIYPMRKHGISDAPARIHLYNAMLDFWTKNL
jgi:dipeptidyl-peptidase-4